jgi:hypothetical protein
MKIVVADKISERGFALLAQPIQAPLEVQDAQLRTNWRGGNGSHS